MSHESTDVCLIAWNEGVRQSLRGTRYGRFADDVAQQFVLELLLKRHEGHAIPSWPGTLPEDDRKRAIQMARKARKMTDVVLDHFKERVQQAPPRRARRRLGKIALNNLKKIESVFNERQVKQMLNHSCEDVVTQKSLAETVGISYRTIKYKFRKIRF